MVDCTSPGSYIVVSPAKDEAAQIGQTLESMIRQTIRPLRWVIVDDGSRDGTSEIAEGYAKKYDWIRVHRLESGAARKLGSGEIQAFAEGLGLAKDLKSDYIVKLDCDIEFPSDYFESLFSKFKNDDRLGIASGQYCEKGAKGWAAVEMPPYHAAGASKVVRADCFHQIAGFPMSPGWDTADEIKAQFRGWKTCHFTDIKFYHLRKEGSASGSIRTNLLHGEVYYACGGGPSFFAFKTLHRMAMERPFFIGGLAMLWAYLSCHLMRKPRLVDHAEARFYRRTLNRRVRSLLTGGAKRRGAARQDGLTT